jgi:phospholipase/carboxylesterase
MRRLPLTPRRIDPLAARGRLLYRPSADLTSSTPKRGLHRLALERGRDGLLYLPAGHTPDAPAPLIVMLHGAGADAHDVLPTLQSLADALDIVLLMPESRSHTWDLLTREYGPDVRFIDRALDALFARVRIDPARIALAGFSDGASYALSLGLANGDLFTHVLAFSPGFVVVDEQVGRPHIFVSHGRDDRVLPVDACSRSLVPRLEKAGYEIRYHEFDGGHIVPEAIAGEAADWFVSEDEG